MLYKKCFKKQAFFPDVFPYMYDGNPNSRGLYSGAHTVHFLLSSSPFIRRLSHMDLGLSSLATNLSSLTVFLLRYCLVPSIILSKASGSTCGNARRSIGWIDEIHFHFHHLIQIWKRSKARVEPEVYCYTCQYKIGTTRHCCTSWCLPEVGIVWYQLRKKVVSRLCVN